VAAGRARGSDPIPSCEQKQRLICRMPPGACGRDHENFGSLSLDYEGIMRTVEVGDRPSRSMFSGAAVARMDSIHDQSSEHDPWRSWLRQFLCIFVAALAATYLFVIVIDPFSTGRLALTQHIDRNSGNQFLSKVGLVRDPQFDGAIFGSSIAGALDPSHIGQLTDRNMVQLSFYGVKPKNTLIVARAYDRHHRGSATLQIFILDFMWCDQHFLSQSIFPDWLYEDSPLGEYLSRMFNPEAFSLAVRRIGMWLGLAEPQLPADGFAPILPRHFDEQVARRALLATKPETDGLAPAAPFPAIDELASHLTALDSRSSVLLVSLPIFVNALPPDGSAAALRVAACKERISSVAEQRPKTAYLDLQLDNAMARDVDGYSDWVHVRGSVARLVEAEIGRAAIRSSLPADDRSVVELRDSRP